MIEKTLRERAKRLLKSLPEKFLIKAMTGALEMVYPTPTRDKGISDLLNILVFYCGMFSNIMGKEPLYLELKEKIKNGKKLYNIKIKIVGIDEPVGEVIFIEKNIKNS